MYRLEQKVGEESEKSQTSMQVPSFVSDNKMQKFVNKYELKGILTVQQKQMSMNDKEQ